MVVPARRARAVLVGAAAVLLLLLTTVVVAVPRRDAGAVSYAPQAGQRDFAVRYSNNVNGQITIAANTIVKCPVDTSDAAMNSACNGSRNGTNARNNNSYDMQWLDYDTDPSTFDSSKADLLLPAGGHVLFAGLYWTGVQVKGDVITYADGSKGVPQAAPNPALIGQVRLRVPGSSTYSTVTASTIDTGPISLNSGYGAFADVTSLVNAAGAGSYYVGNVQTGTGGNAFGGWSLVVAYSDPAEPLRNLTVFDGLKVIGGTSSLVIPLAGFKTPSSGTVRTTVGVVAAEGDAGATGDYLMVNNNRLTDAVHPANNTENSTIANRGSQVTTKGPDWRNQLGYDSSLFVADGFLTNGATTATFAAQTTGDTYAPQAITFATELYSPSVSLTKTVDNATPKPGDTVTYTVTATNSSGTASAVDAEIDDEVPGGLRMAASPTVSVGTVRCDPDCVTPAGIESVHASFGTLAPGASATLTMQMTVASDRPLNEVITNLATMTFVAPDLGLPVSKVASVPVTVAYPDPAVEKTLVSSTANTYEFAVVVTNVGTRTTTGTIDLVDVLGSGGTVITAATGGGWSCGALTTSVTCSTAATLAPGASAPALTVVATYGNGQPVVNEAHLGANKGGQPTNVNSPALLNDSSTASSGVAPYSILTVNKAAVQNTVSIGGSSQFRMIVHNQGPATSTGTALVDSVPAGLEVDSVTPSQGSCVTAPGAAGVTDVTCALGSIPVGDDATVTVVVSPQLSLVGSSVWNTVSVTSDTTQSPVTDGAALDIRAATDLSVVKTADRSTASPGDVITYTVATTNNGPMNAHTISLVDHLPSAIASATATASGSGSCTVSNGVVDCLWGGSHPVGATVTATIVATVKSSFDSNVPAEVQSKNAVNVADVSSDIDEIDSSDNTSAATVKILPFGDLAATASGPGVVAPGSDATLTFTGTNNGPTTTTATVMTIAIPAGLSVVTVPPNCTVSGASISCDLGTMVQGATSGIDVVVSAPAGSAGLAYLSTVSISSAVDDPIPENNSDLTPLYSTQPPIVVNVDPGSGPSEGGTQVTIDGDNLTSDTVVEIGGVPCTPVWFNTAQQLVCTTGPHPPGVVDVVVRTIDGQTSTLVGGFTYTGDVAPTPDEPAVPRYTG